MDWATLRMNRANALSSFGERQGGEEGLQAFRDSIADYDASLEVWTQESAPLQWAKTQMNRATALATLEQRQAGELGLQTLQNAIAGYDASLEILTQESAPLDWATSQMNRANVLLSLGYRQGGAAGLQFLQDAARGYDASLEVWTQETAPHQWATSQMNRANALQRLGKRQGGAAGLQSMQDSVTGYDASLEVFTQESAPLDWATSQMNRANALLRLGERQGGADGVFSRTSALSARLKVVRLRLDHQDSQERMKAARSALPLAMELQAWPEATEAGEALLDQAPEALAMAQTDADRTEIFKSLQFMADRAAIAKAHQGDVAGAALAAEQGRARALRDHFQEAQAALSTHATAALADARAGLANAKAAFENAGDSENRSAAYQDLNAAHGAFRELMEKFNLTAQPLDPDLWRRAAPEGGAAVVFALAPEGAAAFVLPHAADMLTRDHAVMLPEVTAEVIHSLLENEEETGWHDGYLDFRRDIAASKGTGSPAGLTAWSNCIETVLAALDDMIMGPVSDRLKALGLPGGAPVALIAPGLLANLPLHAAGRRVGGRWACFLDRWTPSYAPSLAALAHLNARPAAQGDRLLAITDPLGDLTPDNGNPALAHYRGPVEYAGAAATPEAILAALPHADCVSALCHGTWDPREPGQSGLILAGEQRLTLAQIKQAKLTSGALIALLACETAPVSIGDEMDELENLPLGLIQAGAQGVTATFWPVFGHVADRMMSDFFGQFRGEGAPPAAAMRAAILRLRDSQAAVADEEVKQAAAFYRPDGALDKARIIDGFEKKTPVRSDDLLSLQKDFSLPIHWAVYGYFGR